MSGTGTSTGDFDDDQRGYVAEPDASPETAFVEAASGAAVTGASTEQHAADSADASSPEESDD